MKTLNRILLILLSAALLVVVYLMHTNTTEIAIGHETYYKIKWPWLQEVRETCIFAVLGWCLLFLQRQPTFARIGLAAVIIAFILMNVPLDHESFLHVPPNWR